MLLRSQRFADRFQPRDDAKIDWKRFWVKQMLTLFNMLEALVATLLFVTMILCNKAVQALLRKVGG